MFRVLTFLAGLLSIIFFSPFLTLACGLALSLRYRAWEVLFLGLLTDFMWMPEHVWYAVPYATILAILIVWLSEPLRSAFLSA